jgi:UV DNA damage endonuclease
MDALRQPRSPWAAVEIHGGKAGRARELIEVVRRLPRAVRRRLVLENDEYAYGAGEMLSICRQAGVPMLFDAHHHLVHEQLSSYDDPSVAQYLDAAAGTWPSRDWQMVHISNGRDSLADPRHSIVIRRMPESYRRAPWIEVEAKGKERAIRALRRRWLPAQHSAIGGAGGGAGVGSAANPKMRSNSVQRAIGKLPPDAASCP